MTILKAVKDDTDDTDDIDQDTEIPDPFDPERYALSQHFEEDGGCQEVLTTCAVGKFNKHTFFRVHEDHSFRLNVGILTVDDGLDRDSYLVDPSLHADLFEIVSPTTLFTAISRAKEIRLIPVRLPGDNTAGERWRKSLREAVDIAQKSWIKLVSDRNGGFYRVYKAPGTFPDPVWPKDLSMRNLLKAAFGDKLIGSRDHQVLRKLEGYE